MDITEEQYKEAFTLGYNSGWEFHLGTGLKHDNPYDYMRQQSLYDAWQDGFDRCGEDS